MFGSTYPIFDAQGIVSEYVRNPDLAEYVRWEYRPADRSSVIRSIKRRRTATRRVRFALGRRGAQRGWGEAKELRGKAGGPTGPRVLFPALPRAKGASAQRGQRT